MDRWRTSVCRDRRSSSNTHRSAASITSTQSTGIRPTTTGRDMGRGDRIDCSVEPFTIRSIARLEVLGVLLGASIEAHRLDEYLQAARVDLDLTRVGVPLALTPGVDVAD